MPRAKNTISSGGNHSDTSSEKKNTADIWENIKKYFFTYSMWYKNTAVHMNDHGDENVDTTEQRNLNLPAIVKKVDIIGYIHDDVFRQTRLL